MSTMYKRCKRNCKDKDKDTTEHKKSPGVNTLDYIKQHKINDIERLMCPMKVSNTYMKNSFYCFLFHSISRLYNTKYTV